MLNSVKKLAEVSDLLTIPIETFASWVNKTKPRGYDSLKAFN